MPSRGPNSPPPEPYISPTESPAEATAKAVGAGILFGILFGAANAYLGLRAGLTISTSIPVAVMTVALFRTLRVGGVRSSVLEANLSQTVGSASSSVASGVIFTLPALFLLGFDTSLLQITILAMGGGLLGVLFMIPLRPFLIVREHGTLPYPEGTACAEVLKASETGSARARLVFLGLGVGALLKGVTGWIRAVPDGLQVSIPFLKKAQLGSDVSGALLGVGYILGPRVATIMVGGSFLSWLVIIPILATWGAGRPEPLYPETVLLIDDMAPDLLWTRYIRYIGAGAVAMGGLLTLLRSVPLMVESFRFGARQLRERLSVDPRAPTLPRTELDLPLRVVGVGAAAVFAVLALVPLAFSSIEIAVGRAVAALLVVVFAFFFVTVSSRLRLRGRRAPGAAGDADAAGHRRRAGQVAALEPGGHRRRDRYRHRAVPHSVTAVRRRGLSAGVDDGAGLSGWAPAPGARTPCDHRRGAAHPPRPWHSPWVRAGGR